ncbi:MAG: hypothetical protein ACK4OM_00215 [Alphaproteobacteria bacterium]
MTGIEFSEKANLSSAQLLEIAKTTRDNVVTQVINDDTEGYIVYDDQEKIKESINSALRSEGYIDHNKIIHELHILRDLQNGIKIYEKDSNLIRDTRDTREKTSDKFSTKIAYQIQFLNMVRSAQILMAEYVVEDKKEDEIKAKLKEMAKHFYENIEKIDNEKEQQKFLLEHNNILIENVAKTLDIPQKQLRKEIQLTMDYANFEDNHYNLSTISKIEGKTSEIEGKIVVQSDVAIVGTTEEQKGYYQSLFYHKSQSGNFSELENELKNDKDNKFPEFFKNLSSTEQRLVYRNIDDLYYGRKVHNTQLRNIPGVKNAYNYSVAIWDGTNLQEKLSELRIGTVYCTNECKDSEKISASSLKQLKEATGKKIIHFTSLVTPFVPNIKFRVFNKPIKVLSHIETDVFNAAKAATSATNDLHSNVALNNMRRLVSNHYEGLEIIIPQIAVDLAPRHEGIQDYLNSGKGYEKAIQQLESKLSDKEAKIYIDDKEFIENLIQLKKLILSYKGLERDEHKGLLEINTRASKIFTHISEKGLINLISCKSGKDRTGMQALLNSAKALETELGKSLEDISLDLTKTGHLQIMSAKQGGRQGCFGILPGTGAAFPSKFRETRELFALESAKFNKDKQGMLKEYKKKNIKSHDLFKWEEVDSLNEISQSQLPKDAQSIEEPKQELQPLTLIQNEYSKRFNDRINEIVQLKALSKSYESELQNFIAEIKTFPAIPKNVEKTEQGGNKVVFGDNKTGFISIITNGDGTYSFKTKPGDNGGINCLYPIPRKNAPGSFDLLKFENGQLTGVIESTKGTSSLNKENIEHLTKIHKKSIVPATLIPDLEKIAKEEPKPPSQTTANKTRRHSI